MSTARPPMVVVWVGGLRSGSTSFGLSTVTCVALLLVNNQMLPSNAIFAAFVSDAVIGSTGRVPASSTATTLASWLFALRMVSPLGPTPNIASRSLAKATVCGVPSCSFEVEIVRTAACFVSMRNAPPAPCTASCGSRLSVSGSSCTLATT
jgi:hypothetical protein